MEVHKGGLRVEEGLTGVGVACNMLAHAFVACLHTCSEVAHHFLGTSFLPRAEPVQEDGYARYAGFNGCIMTAALC
jgi:hypothetical protein